MNKLLRAEQLLKASISCIFYIENRSQKESSPIGLQLTLIFRYQLNCQFYRLDYKMSIN